MLWLTGCETPEDDAAQFAIQFRSPTPYQVQEDDTVDRVAQRWGVTPEEVRKWNPALDKPAEGETLYVFVPPGTEPLALAAPAKQAPRPRRAAPRSRCKALPSDAAEGSIVTAEGLSSSQIQRAVSKRLPRATGCLPSTLRGTYEMIVEIKVGCDGRVSNTYTISSGALGTDVARCVERVFKGTRFPRHDMPDGMSFQYPITFTQ